MSWARQMNELAVRGFDACRPTPTGVRVGCSQCQALVIQGVACHETGCPRASVRDDAESASMEELEAAEQILERWEDR